MKFRTRDRSAVETVFVVSTIFGLFSCCISTLPFSVQPDEVATVVGKAFSYKLSAEMSSHPGYTFKFHAPDSDNLPSWLYYDDTRNLLLGIPSYHDKGSHAIQLDVINHGTNKTTDKFNFLTIEIVEYEEELNHFNTLRTNTLAKPGKNTSQSSLNCPSHAPVIVATLVFDLNSRKLSGADRVKLLNSVSEWTGIDVDQHRWMPGKGEKTAFNLKDVVVLTAGPGWVRDAQERGVSVSWKIGCGDSITENESYVSVSHLKSASQTGAFKNDLSSPVVAWHVTYGRVKHRQVVRVRRQALAQTPVPTSTFIAPTASIITPSVVVHAPGTPSLARSPTVFTVTPTAARIIPSPTRTTSPSATPVVPSVIVPPTKPENEAPFIANRINNLTAVINEPFIFYISPNTFHDKEDGSTPNLHLEMYDTKGNPLPLDLWVKLNQKSQKLFGFPKHTGETTIALIVTDSGGLKSELLHVNIKVVRINNPPFLYNHIDLIRLRIGQPLVFKVPIDTFHDKEDGSTTNLTLSLRAVENEDTYSWIEFDDESQTIYALPRGEIIGRHEFHLIAKDHGGKSSYDALEFNIKPALVKEPNHRFGLKLDAEYDKFEKSAANRVKLCVQVGDYFGDYFNTSYKNMRVKEFSKGSVILTWYFANIATNLTAVRMYRDQFVVPDDTKNTPVSELKEHMKSSCPISTGCSVTEAWVRITEPISTTPDPNVLGRAGDEEDGTWWEYTIIPAFVIAALIFIIGLIIIICIRCRRKSRLDENEKVVFVQRKKPAVFREEYPMREVYGNQPLITPNEKAPLPPPAYPRSSTPTEDPSERLLSDSSPSYQAPFDSGHEPAGNSRPSVASYRLPPPYVAP